MIKNYLKIAWRNLRKNRLYTIVNIAGLAMGITCCILIGLYITHELSYDRFHANADRIVRVTMEYSSSGTVEKTPVTGTKVGPQLQRSLPGIESYVRLYKNPRVVSFENNKFEEGNFLFADSGFFSIFSFPLVQGNAQTALDAPNKVVFTQSAAKKYFNNTDPLGKIVQIGDQDYIVSGITADPPGASQVQFDMVASFANLGASRQEQWWSANYITYLLLTTPGQTAGIQKQVSRYMETVTRTELGATGGDYLTFNIEPLKKVHLYSRLEGLVPNGNILYIYILGLVAVLILCVACVNYTNLATAQSAGRSTEIGIRKVMGARKGELFRQFIGESFVLTFIALLAALIATTLLLPLFNQLTGKELQANEIFRPVRVLVYLGLTILISFTAGAYPALVLSGFKMIKVLKPGTSITRGNSTARKSLIVFQFAVSLFLVMFTIVILQQLSYIRNKNLGYNKDHILVLPADYRMRPHLDDLKKAMTLHADVTHITGAYETPSYIEWGDGISTGSGTTEKSISVTGAPVSLDYINTMGMEIVAGSDFTPADLQLIDTADYSKSRYAYMLNESAVKALGWTPEEAIGKTVSKGVPGTVKAVVKDFHFASLHRPVEPLLLFLDNRFVNQLLVKISGNNTPATLQHLQQVWNERVPHRPFEYHFLDEEYDTMYKTETRAGQVFSTFAFLAILLACLGLFALAAFTAMKRTKEIGIRKVLGATVIHITALLSKDFLKLVLIATVIITPVAWYAAHRWLQEFTYRTAIHWWVFVAAGAAAVLLALLTISMQAVKAALTNPVKSLRTE